jgi:hypothetical protein
MSDSPTFQSRRERRAAESNTVAQQPVEQTFPDLGFEPDIPSSSQPVADVPIYKPYVPEAALPLIDSPRAQPYSPPPSEPQSAKSRRELRGLNDLKESAATDRAPLFDDHTLTGSVPVIRAFG